MTLVMTKTYVSSLV